MRTAHNVSYELTFILGEAATPEMGKQKTEEITKLIEKFEGKVEKDEQWGRRDLAYLINRNRTGYYVSLWFELPTNQVKPLEEALRFDESVIRHLVTKAYTTAQPGSLYPVVEEEKPARTDSRSAKTETTEAVSAEEELRRTTTTTTKKKAAPKAKAEEALSEEDRLKQLDEVVDELLKADQDDKTTSEA